MFEGAGNRQIEKLQYVPTRRSRAKTRQIEKVLDGVDSRLDRLKRLMTIRIGRMKLRWCDICFRFFLKLEQMISLDEV